MKKPKIKEVIKKTPRHLMPTGKELSPERLQHIELGRAAARERIEQRKKEKELEKYI